jgi:hypothetical protein
MYSTACTTEEWGFDSRQGQDIFLFSTAFRPAMEPTQHQIQWSLRIKRPGNEADHAFVSSAEVNSGQAIPPLAHTSSWHGRDNFAFAAHFT